MYFVWILHIFCNGYTYFFGVLDVCFKCFAIVHLNVSKVDLVLHMLQWDPPTVVHVCGKQRDRTCRGVERRKRRGMVVGAQVVPSCACSRARVRAIPSDMGGTDNFTGYVGVTGATK
jgi:hypothetical protein